METLLQGMQGLDEAEPTTVGEINREVVARCSALGLQYDCGADGIFNAEIAVIAEAPGDRERTLKMPLSGGSGKFLWDALRKYGINRRSVYISNVIKRQLLGSGDVKEKISDHEVQMYSGILQWELQQLPRLKYIVCLGNFALQAITGLRGINSYRGSVLRVQLRHGSEDDQTGQSRVRDVTVLAMVNPAAVLRDPKQELMFRFDCDRLNDLITGKFKEYEVNCIINPTLEEALGWIERMRTDGKPVGLDIETSSGETICVGLANDPHEGMCINFRDAHDNRWSVEDELKIWQAIDGLVTDPTVRFA